MPIDRYIRAITFISTPILAAASDGAIPSPFDTCEDRPTYAAALAKFPIPETDRTSVVAALREQLEMEPVPFVRSAAMSALGTFAVPQPDRTSVADALRERLEKDQDPNVRNAAAAALLNFGPVGRDTVLAE